MDVGSGRLPLRSIADNSIGEHLAVEINDRADIRSLLAAIRHNHTLKSFVVAKMDEADILWVRMPVCECYLKLTAKGCDQKQATVGP